MDPRRRLCYPMLLSVAMSAPLAWAQPLVSLKTVKVPETPGLERYVRDRAALLVLGKALFWDMQVGSDGRTDCATCHFHAGADHRAQNQISNPAGSLQVNHTLSLNDFPFRVFANQTDSTSPVLRDSSPRAGSAGIFRRTFAGLDPAGGELASDAQGAPTFARLNVRQVTPRNTPSVINAVFQVRNFWDGRASDIFNGANPFGDSDTRANVRAVVDGGVVQEMVRLTNASLASQAVGPPVNPVEMAYEGRGWPDLARRLLPARPLDGRQVARDDSVLGSLAGPGRGMHPALTYLALVQSAFQPVYWDWPEPVNGLSLAEANFPLFFGLAIQAYESTLVSAESRVDRFLDGDIVVLTAQELEGMAEFQSSGRCSVCHAGAETTAASFTALAQLGPAQGLISRSPNGQTTGIPSDTGFMHTGVRPAAEDPGLDASDDFGVPFSTLVRRQGTKFPTGIAGAFKTPGLRNVQLTGPYFHNGGQATLDQVVEFYRRGGDFPGDINIPIEITRLNLSARDRAAIVAFMEALTDDRVRFERAPFDHPEICVPVGYPDAASARTARGLTR